MHTNINIHTHATHRGVHIYYRKLYSHTHSPTMQMTHTHTTRGPHSLINCNFTHTWQVGDNLHRGVSGGERKRVCIGVELVTSPKIIFLDEPTSGLDSATTLDVVRVLKNLSRSGQTIICTIHQPSAAAFAMFDQLVLLSRGKVRVCACVYMYMCVCACAVPIIINQVC